MSLLKLFSKLVGLSADESSGEKLFHQGLQCHQYGNQDDAIKYFTQSITSSPNHAAVFLNRGGCYMIQERYLDAFDDYLHVISLEKNGRSLDAEPCTPAAFQNIKRIEPFIAFEKEHGKDMRGQLAQDGIQHFSKRWAEIICVKFLMSENGAISQFVFEELTELEEMGGEHQEYALNCGVAYTQFSRVTEDFDTQSAFLFFKGMLCCFSRDPKKMFLIRTAVLDKIILMKNLAQSSSTINSRESELYNLDTLGKAKFLKLKKLIDNKEVLDALQLSLVGERMFAPVIAMSVQEGVSYLNYLHALTGLNGLKLLAKAGEENDEEFVCLINSCEALKGIEVTGSNEYWLETLLEWADEFKLPNLTQFDSLGYPMTGFPKTKAELLNLEYLHLPNCNISYLPKELGRLKNLYKICLDNNQLTEFPSELCYLDNLIVLDLENNHLSSLPEEIGSLTSLQKLCLKGNSVSELPESLYSLESFCSVN